MTWQAWLFLGLLVFFCVPWPLMYRAHVIRVAQRVSVADPVVVTTAPAPPDDLVSFTASNGWTALIVDPPQGRPYILLRNPARTYRVTSPLPRPTDEPNLRAGLVATAEFIDALTPNAHPERKQ
jgi:hypothetical protein